MGFWFLMGMEPGRADTWHDNLVMNCIAYCFYCLLSYIDTALSYNVTVLPLFLA